jgi:hypothetical protein
VAVVKIAPAPSPVKALALVAVTVVPTAPEAGTSESNVVA